MVFNANFKFIIFGMTRSGLEPRFTVLEEHDNYYTTDEEHDNYYTTDEEHDNYYTTDEEHDNYYPTKLSILS
jgi:hypothetical protein